MVTQFKHHQKKLVNGFNCTVLYFLGTLGVAEKIGQIMSLCSDDWMCLWVEPTVQFFVGHRETNPSQRLRLYFHLSSSCMKITIVQTFKQNPVNPIESYRNPINPRNLQILQSNFPFSRSSPACFPHQRCYDPISRIKARQESTSNIQRLYL